MKIRQKKTVVLAVFISLAFLLLISSMVSASCSIGASPLEMSASAHPGQTVDLTWNIINLRGDRPTHVLISQSSGPNWGVVYSPEAANKTYDVSGIQVSSFENFAVPVSEVVTARPDSLPSGKVAYVTHPNASAGYILVDDQIKISITLPNDAKIGQQEDFVFTALGKCFGETGSVSASLATELKVHITPSTSYYEKPIGSTSTNSSGINLAGLFGARMENPTLLIAVGSTLLLIIILLILIMFMIRRKAKKYESKSSRKRGR